VEVETLEDGPDGLFLPLRLFKEPQLT
jgi:hypothetical protein